LRDLPRLFGEVGMTAQPPLPMRDDERYLYRAGPGCERLPEASTGACNVRPKSCSDPVPLATPRVRPPEDRRRCRADTRSRWLPVWFSAPPSREVLAAGGEIEVSLQSQMP